MVKCLIGGDLCSHENWTQLANRLKELQASAHGPFHIAFLTGQIACAPTADVLELLSSLEIKLYALSCPTLSADEVVAYNAVVETLPLKRKGIVSIKSNLTVAFFRESIGDYSNGREDEEISSIVNSVGYRGCDFLFSLGCWPADLYQFLDGTDLQTYTQLGLPMGGSREVADFAMTARPRYHFSGAAAFYQRSPYVNHPSSSSSSSSRYGPSSSSSSSSSNQPTLYTRFISLANVSESKDKERKWLHALSLVPIIVMKNAEIEEAPPAFTECPYLRVGVATSTGQKRAQPSSALDGERDPKRFRAAIAESEAVSGADGTFFFGQKGHVGGQQASGGKGLNLVPPSPTAVTLFVGGLLPESDARDLGRTFGARVRHVRRTPGKRYAFVDLFDHASAAAIVARNQSRPFVLDGRSLVVGWAAAHDAAPGGGNGSGSHSAAPTLSEEEKLQQAMNERELVPPTEDSRVLYIGNLPHGADDAALTEALTALCPGLETVQRIAAKNFCFATFVDYAHAMAVVTRSLNERMALQQRPLVIGWARPIDKTLHGRAAQPPFPGCTVVYLGRLPREATVAHVEALLVDFAVASVRKPDGRDYAFVECADADTAQRLFVHFLDTPVAFPSVDSTAEAAATPQLLSVGWAKGRAAAQHDTAPDCWFCLASPSVRVHLVVSVGDHAYLALPRGGLSPDHVLLCPIDCVPSRLHLSSDARREVLRYLRGLEKFYAQQGHVLLTFERAVRTRHAHSRDHMQIHCVPLPHSQLALVDRVFADKAAEYGYQFHELPPGGVALEDFVLTAEGGPYQEYFYIELPYEVRDATTGEPTGVLQRRRFVYLHDPSLSSSTSDGQGEPRPFLMSLGQEMAAHMLEQPERAFWKNCVMSDEDEAANAERLREAFAPFDPSVAT